VFVLQVGRLDRPLKPPRRPWEVARVSFEIARRHRFVRELAELPDAVECHVLPVRGTSPRDDTLVGSRDFSGVQERIDATYEATRSYLEDHLSSPRRSSAPSLGSPDERLDGDAGEAS
jgi:NTE family protein